ncbi:ABC transporter ATP-binding protein [Paracoccus aerodenitrificans]|uniref:ABC transporter ATP-binding protein n=1 Tax=Paracoccus aerodenitrificans TaxID=3017781 RepID=UPI0022F0B6C9|nr:ABC transporter ATP-binding protein [Paracoccus aerodenitrificans]WBU63521.1 ABC transporter ATP-binding protein [Paracoccus aerodenitrificans]
MSTPALSISHLQKTYHRAGTRIPVLSDVSLTLDFGQSLALTGESGSGKSTLLHLIAGLDRPDGGKIVLSGQDICDLPDRALARLRRQKVALIFQQFNLIPSLNVSDNLAMHARLASRYDADWTRALADRLGLAGLAERMPDQISGGQRQRVAIGRAMALRPDLLLADEPTGNLDEETADQVMAELLGLVEDIGCALLMVTHSTRLANRLEARLHLSHGQVALP